MGTKSKKAKKTKAPAEEPLFQTEEQGKTVLGTKTLGKAWNLRGRTATRVKWNAQIRKEDRAEEAAEKAAKAKKKQRRKTIQNAFFNPNKRRARLRNLGLD